MNCEQKKIRLARVIENRIIERISRAQKAVKSPTKFILMKTDDDQLVCKWTQSCTAQERERGADNIIHAKAGGFTADEWDSLVKRFWHLL